MRDPGLPYRFSVLNEFDNPPKILGQRVAAREAGSTPGDA